MLENGAIVFNKKTNRKLAPVLLAVLLLMSLGLTLLYLIESVSGQPVVFAFTYPDKGRGSIGVNLPPSLLAVSPLLIEGYYCDKSSDPAITGRLEPESSCYDKPDVDQGKFVKLDLDKMLVATYEDGILLNEYEIVAIGTPRFRLSRTPKGEFEAGYKSPKHFSSISHVWMPWALQFSGDYFIHGIPYFPDGRRLTSKYSGGCVRLKDEDARAVYEFASRGTPIHVYYEKTYSRLAGGI